MKRKHGPYIRLPFLRFPAILVTDPLQAARIAAMTAARSIADLCTFAAAETPPQSVACKMFLSKWKELDTALRYLKRAISQPEVHSAFTASDSASLEFAGYCDRSYVMITQKIGMQTIRTLWRFINVRKWAHGGKRSLLGAVPTNIQPIVLVWGNFRVVLSQALKEYSSERLVLLEEEFRTARVKLRASPATTGHSRTCADRDRLWFEWSQEGLRPAKIRDRWNDLSEEQRKKRAHTAFQKIAGGNAGRDVVRKALEREGKRRTEQLRPEPGTTQDSSSSVVGKHSTSVWASGS